MAQRNKQNKTQQEYYKQRKRIQSYINRKKKEGIVFSEDVIPSVPKKITQSSVNGLQKLTAKELQKKMLFNSQTGEVFNGTSLGQVTEEYYPQVNMVDSLKNQIRTLPINDNDYSEEIVQDVKNSIIQLPREGYGRAKGGLPYYNDYSDYIQQAISIIDDNLANYDEDYLKFIYDNNSNIAKAINDIKNIPTSDGTQMRQGYQELLELLNMNHVVALHQFQ